MRGGGDGGALTAACRVGTAVDRSGAFTRAVVSDKPTRMATAALDPAALDAARRLVAIARARYPVVEAWLYGSHARGEARADSDVDVAVVVDGTRSEARSAGRDLAGDSFDILRETGHVVSPLTLSAADWNAPQEFTNPFLLRNIRRDGLML